MSVPGLWIFNPESGVWSGYLWLGGRKDSAVRRADSLARRCGQVGDD